MQLTIQATGENVEVISYLLAKNPNNIYERSQNGHFIRMFYNKFSDEIMEVTFFVTPDPIELSRNRAKNYDITSYINDREFVVSSIFCSLLRSALGTALNGKPKESYASWVEHPFLFEFSFGPLATDLLDHEIIDIFQPLGYEVKISYGETDYQVKLKERSSARYISLKGSTTLQNGLRQLFVLIPVLDNYKHYYIDEKETEKVERYGEEWLHTHPLRDFILRRALRFKELYSELEENNNNLFKEQQKELRLNELRYKKIIDYINRSSVKETIVDFGSGEGNLALQLGLINGVREILAVEPSESAMLKAMKRFDAIKQSDNFIVPTPIIGSLFYYDERLKSKDIMILCEVIEHIDEYRLPKVMQTILSEYQPKLLIITTPNKEYNQVYEMDEAYRHPDHRFEWTRQEFFEWCHSQKTSNYEVAFDGIGDEHVKYGFPTQMCLFIRKEGQ